MTGDELSRCRKAIDQLPSRRLLVLGDVMLDRYIRGRVTRISPEAPVPVVEASQTHHAPGGAANVAMNVAHLGARVSLLGVVGDDEEGRQLRAAFADNGIDVGGLVVDPSRPTTSKTRVIAQNQQVVRVDRETREPVGPSVVRALLEHAAAAMADVDAVVISDYAKGVALPDLLQGLIREASAHGRPVVVDPKGFDYGKYAGATVVAPNRVEAAQFANHDARDDQVLPLAAGRLLEQLGCRAVLITRGEEGMSLFERDGQVSHIPAVAREVYDVTGAGDTVAGVLTLALAAGAPLLACAHLANCAAGLVVGKLGAATVSPQELRAALQDQALDEAR